MFTFTPFSSIKLTARGCSSDIAFSYYFRPSKVTEHAHHGLVGASLKQNQRNLKKPNPNPTP